MLLLLFQKSIEHCRHILYVCVFLIYANKDIDRSKSVSLKEGFPCASLNYEAACHADVLTALLYRRCVPNTPISLTKLLSLGAALDIPIRSKGPRGKIHTVLSLRIRQRWRLFSSYRTSFSGTFLERYRRTRPPPPPSTSLPPTSARATPPLTPGQG